MCLKESDSKKKIICAILLLALAVLSVSALAEGARIGALTCIGMTEDDVKALLPN